jgi:hypothetical protein
MLSRIWDLDKVLKNPENGGKLVERFNKNSPCAFVSQRRQGLFYAGETITFSWMLSFWWL